jgi:hypothetical protein
MQTRMARASHPEVGVEDHPRSRKEESATTSRVAVPIGPSARLDPSVTARVRSLRGITVQEALSYVQAAGGDELAASHSHRTVGGAPVGRDGSRERKLKGEEVGEASEAVLTSSDRYLPLRSNRASRQFPWFPYPWLPRCRWFLKFPPCPSRRYPPCQRSHPIRWSPQDHRSSRRWAHRRHLRSGRRRDRCHSRYRTRRSAPTRGPENGRPDDLLPHRNLLQRGECWIRAEAVRADER